MLQSLTAVLFLALYKARLMADKCFKSVTIYSRRSNSRRKEEECELYFANKAIVDVSSEISSVELRIFKGAAVP